MNILHNQHKHLLVANRVAFVIIGVLEAAWAPLVPYVKYKLIMAIQFSKGESKEFHAYRAMSSKLSAIFLHKVSSFSYIYSLFVSFPPIICIKLSNY